MMKTVKTDDMTREDVPARRDSMRANTVAMLASQASTWATALVTFTLLARYLGSAGLGRYQLVIAFFNIGITVAGLGMNLLITRELARDRARGTWLAATGVWITLGLGIVAGLVTMVAAIAIGTSRDLAILLGIASAGMPFGALTLFVYGAVQGIEVMRYQAFGDVGSKIIFVAGALVLVAVDAGVRGFVALYIATQIYASTATLSLLRHAVGVKLRHFSWTDVRYLVRAGIPFGSTSLSLVIYGGLDVILLSALATSTAAGIYAAPMTLFRTLLFLPNIVIAVSFPRLAAAAATEDDAGLAFARSSLRVVLTLTLPLSIGLAGGARDGLPLLVGDEFTASVPVLMVLAFVLLPTSSNMVLNRVLIAANRERVWTGIMISSVVAKAMCSLAFVPLFDTWFGNAALGAAFALLTVEVGMLLAAMRFAPSGFLDRAARRGLLRLALAGGAALCIAVLLAIGGPGLFGLPAAVGSLAYVALAGVVGVHSREEIVTALDWVRGRSRVPTASESG